MDRVIYIGEPELTRLLVQFIKHYKFHHNNEYPEKIVLPAIKKIEGVIIEQGIELEPELIFELTPLAIQPEPKPKKRKKRKVKHAITSGEPK